ncbi:MAG: hypothetical protein HQK51_02720 [Oligoflexia bacterium]|nr:hypothetical protein [Oligoflexia bacterium]
MRVFVDGIALKLFYGAKVKDAFLFYFSSCVDSILPLNSSPSSYEYQSFLRKKFTEKFINGEIKILDRMENELLPEGALSEGEVLKTFPPLKTLIITEVNHENC